jgi:hypothetical protein
MEKYSSWSEGPASSCACMYVCMQMHTHIHVTYGLIQKFSSWSGVSIIPYFYTYTCMWVCVSIESAWYSKWWLSISIHNLRAQTCHTFKGTIVSLSLSHTHIHTCIHTYITRSTWNLPGTGLFRRKSDYRWTHLRPWVKRHLRRIAKEKTDGRKSTFLLPVYYWKSIGKGGRDHQLLCRSEDKVQLLLR